MATTTRTITIPSQLDPVAVLGPVDEVIREVERAFPELTIIVRGNRVAVVSRSKQTESQAAQAEDLINTIIQAAYTAPMDADTVRRMLDQNVLRNSVRLERPGHGPTHDKLVQSTAGETRGRIHGQSHGQAGRETTYRKPTVPGVITFAAGVPVRAKTAGQVAYVNAIESHTITFGIGPAGTGKTYLAVAKAVRAFQDKQIRRIILTRPAVEAGENLGFLPGTLNDKVDPYLRPLYDALGDMLGADQLRRLMDDNTIEVAPLAYMRGRTLNDAFVILDEAQNTTEQQMKMFLTRLGFNTKMVITGDISQVDLAVPRSGLATIEQILGDIEGISFVHLDTEDVVRHQLVGRIVAAYDRHAAIAGDHRSIERHGRRRGRTAEDGTAGSARSGGTGNAAEPMTEHAPADTPADTQTELPMQRNEATDER
ncbi:PhoH family protein [Bifidobacterium miconisargentati]|uniref:PhoH family protein n=1 Tax=Bifidobacterium miconisargentati TaxID=2834437 RepID=UPI001BDCF753|nr:PhoH family protein [Bifidobacterium miconisargentati]